MTRYIVLFIIFIVSFVQSVAYGQDVKTYVPANCEALIPIVKTESKTFMPNFKEVWYYNALIEHESCISLKHSKCCSPKAKLSTKREYDADVGQITKAYNEDGSIRFDALGDLKKRYNDELRELSWLNIHDRVDLQVRTMVLMTRTNYNQLLAVKSELERIRMADSAYNGGLKAVLNARIACGLAAGCDSQQWFGHTERYINKSKKPLYAGRSALDINLHHVKDVTVTRRDKYRDRLD